MHLEGSNGSEHCLSQHFTMHRSAWGGGGRGGGEGGGGAGRLAYLLMQVRVAQLCAQVASAALPVLNQTIINSSDRHTKQKKLSGKQHIV